MKWQDHSDVRDNKGLELTFFQSDKLSLLQNGISNNEKAAYSPTNSTCNELLRDGYLILCAKFPRIANSILIRTVHA